MDIKTVDVKTTLDGGADVLIIMLGMNNVLSPDIGNTPEAVDGWIATYRNLIGVLRARTHPRVVALATPTLCTEDVASPKNVLMDKMSLAMNDLATAEQCIILPVRDVEKKMLIDGRSHRPDFHVTKDFVHPTPFGHLAIATGMLSGLGEDAAVKTLNDDRAPALWKVVDDNLPAFSYAVQPQPVADTAVARSDVQTFKIHFWMHQPDAAKVTLNLPQGWTSTAATINAATGEFIATGPLDHLQNVLTLSLDQNGVAAKTEVVIPAAWIVGGGHYGNQGWSVVDRTNKFDPIKGRLPMDDQLSHGIGFDKPVDPPAPNNKNTPIKWTRYIASVNFPGGADPGSVDLSAVYYFSSFDVAYGSRWIYSPKERTVPVAFDSQTFAGVYDLCLWLNGQTVRDSTDKKGTAELKLQKGWNSLIFKSNHLTWQWQFDIKLVEAPGDDLSDLRFSTVPH